MTDLLEYIVKGITKDDDFSIEKKVEDEGGREIYEIKAGPDSIGIIIGKRGKTIKSIRNLMRVRAVLEKKSVFVTVSEKN